MRIPRIVPLAALLALVMVAFTVAQTSPSLEPPVGATDPSRRQRPDDTLDAQMRARMEREANRKWNKERQAALKKDTDKLLELATQLKQQVDKSNENILSLDVVKKSEEIEKLAHSVRDKMKAHSY